MEINSISISPNEIKILEYLKNIFKTKQFSDITFIVENTKIKAHKFILSQIPYFEKLFSNGMKESNQNEIEIKDIDFETFDFLIKYMYGLEINCSDEQTLKLYKVADMLNFIDFKNDLFFNISRNRYSCFFFLCYDHLFSKEEIEKLFHNLSIKSHSFYPLCFQGEIKPSFKVLKKILKLNKIFQETKLFEICCEWTDKNYHLCEIKDETPEKNKKEIQKSSIINVFLSYLFLDEIVDEKIKVDDFYLKIYLEKKKQNINKEIKLHNLNWSNFKNLPLHFQSWNLEIEKDEISKDSQILKFFEIVFKFKVFDQRLDIEFFPQHSEYLLIDYEILLFDHDSNGKLIWMNYPFQLQLFKSMNTCIIPLIKNNFGKKKIHYEICFHLKKRPFFT